MSATQLPLPAADNQECGKRPIIIIIIKIIIILNTIIITVPYACLVYPKQACEWVMYAAERPARVHLINSSFEKE